MAAFLILFGIAGMGYGLWASSRTGSLYAGLASLLALAGLAAALAGAVAVAVPGFFAGGLSAALEGLPGLGVWLEKKGWDHLFLFSAFVFGAVIGSFLNVCIARLPKAESLIWPRSYCPACKTPIPYYDNIPLLSYVSLQGRCRFCRERIAPRYFVVELLTALLSALLWRRFGFGFAFFVHLIFVAALIVISFIDIDLKIVPDVISLPGIALGFLFSILDWLFSLEPSSTIPSPPSSLFGILLGGAILLLIAWSYEFITGKEGMGGGDVKLLAMIGAFLGWSSVLLTLFFASLSGSIIGIGLMVKEGADGKYRLPFAPFLCLGALFHLLFGKELLSLYFPLIGL